ncbi:MMPL family transporter [Ferribacterium limneticum]|uniref:MMPL family transporter n=1 Tax=Ferribacterium limneticum TaxID=76259 RepID=UPI001CFA3B5B|nr:MMPL family transporter [Ferribacterium limneticum]UCV28510.1 MMPL family transporter [Ferribacterium limneticum]UCV32427.1 MMPL family transporter [Ferribacterium limneticum]
MTRPAVRAFLIWLLAMLAGAVVVWNSHFSADMSFFLPAKPSAEQQVLVDQLKEGVVSRLLMVAIEGGDAAQRAKASRDLRGRLEKLPEFVSVQNGEAGSLDADRDFLFAHRYLLSPAVKPERFTVDGLRDAVANSIDLLASPAGMMLKPFLTRDPTGELVEMVSGLNAGAQPNVRDGVWASRDGERAMLLIQTAALGSDTDGQEKAIGLIGSQFSEAASGGALSLQLSGPGLFAVKSRATIKGEVSRLSTISTLAIIAVLFFVYRSGRLMTLGLLPVLSGALAGVAAVSLAYGTVFGITVGFGSALIGEAVDYSIYYFVQSSKLGVEQWRARFWPTIRLGVLTSICGFAALLFSGFPGLSQLGLYSLSGVLAAAIVTRFILPQLAGSNFAMRDLSHLGPVLKRGITVLQGLRWPVILLTLAAMAVLLVNRDHLWHPNLSALSTVSAEDGAVDQALRADISAPDARYMAVITAPDCEAALQAAERAGQQLDGLIAQGIIGGYDSPARFLPSQAMQASRRASLPTGEELQARLQVALTDSPLAANKLGGFIEDVAKTKGHGSLSREALNGTSLALAVDSLLLQRPNGWSVLLPLRPPVGNKEGDTGVDIAIEPVRAALAGSGALFVDMKNEFDTLYNDYLHEATLLSLAGFVAIVALLAVTLRSPRRLATVLLPLLIAVVLVIAGLHLAGEQLHLLHLIGMLLIVAVGSNYALFFDRAARGEGLDTPTLVSMAVANLTTAIGFGTLALSNVPVLHAVGATVGPGAILALLLSACFVGRKNA